MRHWQTNELPVGTLRHAELETAVETLINALPFAGHTNLNQLVYDVPAYLARCVCIPMRNEQDQLQQTCRALELALTGFEADSAVIFVSNETTDRSVEMATEWAQSCAIGYVVADLSLDNSISTASHSRRLATDIAAWLTPTGVLLTTDADTQVAADWVSQTQTALGQSDGLICGSVSIDPETEARLPKAVRECGTVEGEYSRALARLWRVWAGPKAPQLIVNAMGASLAMSSANYLAAGRMPTPAVAEDKALAAACRLAGIPVTESASVQVVTSGRMDARARGGMGDALRDRAQSRDPLCDEALIPVSVLKARADAWFEAANAPDRDAAFELKLTSNPALTDKRMRLGEVRSELRKARQFMLSRGLGGRPMHYKSAD